jgi:nucleoside-diphosphate-sugar epimerase
MLVRDESTVERALSPLGVDMGRIDVRVGDVTDGQAVAATLRDADAVLHAASVFSFDSRQNNAMLDTNERSTEVVLDAARRAGVGAIVYVSSVVARWPSPGTPINEHSPVGSPRGVYLRSKASAELVARRFQADGVPVKITYPPALLGPHDPKLGDQSVRLRNMLRGVTPIWPTGGLPMGDVRDTAALHATLVNSTDGGIGRYFGAGHYLSTREYVRAARDITGRKLPTVYFPARAMLPLGKLVDAVQHTIPWHIPAEYSAIYACACATRVDAGADTAGLSPRPFETTLRDTVMWLHANGQVTDRQAGAVLRAVQPVA